MLSFTNEDEALAGFEGTRGVYLRIVRVADGKRLSQCELPDMPVFDGMAAANGRLYLSLKKGSVVCLEAAPRSPAMAGRQSSDGSSSGNQQPPAEPVV
jgi:hypothetical protein